MDDDTGAGAVRLLWYALAWGADVYRGGTDGEIRSMRKSEDARYILRDAARLAASDPWAAFSQLQPYPGDNAIGSPGASSFTRYLLRRRGPVGPPLPHRQPCGARHASRAHPAEARENHDADTYLAAVSVMETWAREVSTPDRHVAADEVERWACASAD